MSLKDNLKFGINLSKKFVRRSLATALTFSLLFNASSNLKVRANAKVESIPVEQLRQMPFDQLQERKDLLEQKLAGQTKGTSEYTQTVKDLTDAAEVSIDQKNQETTELNLQMDEQQKKIDALKEEIKVQSDKLKQALEAIYIAGGDAAFLNLFFKSEGMKDFVDTADTVKVINDSYTETLQSLEKDKAELDKQQKEFEAKKQELSQVLQNLEEQRKKFEQFMKENAEAIEKMCRERMEASRASEAADQAGVTILSGVSKSGRYIWPVPGYYRNISAPFGDGRNHLGIDIAASHGTPIVAAADGVVTHAGSSGGGYGNYVEISHSGGYSTLYAHQSVIAARVGQTVKQGQVIGYVGSTGNSTGPHLHFETRLNNTPYNPEIEV